MSYSLLRKSVYWLLVFLFVLAGSVPVQANPTGQSPTQTPAHSPGLGDAPLFPEPGPIPQAPTAPEAVASATCTQPGCVYLPQIFKQDTSLSRAESMALYQTLYLPSGQAASGWAGDVNGCQAGTTTDAFKTSVLNRINYYRRTAGVPPLTGLNPANNAKAQQAALMMSRQGDVNHQPPTNWGCYSVDGAEAARNSNLALGRFGPEAITAYMIDYGPSNTAVGHRRWLLYPQTQLMGTGDLPATPGHYAANALWVFDSHTFDSRPVTRTPYVAWPPDGYIPYPVVFARWSFSYPNANFSNATVSLTRDGATLGVTLYPPSTSYGEPTLVWLINGMSDGDAWPRPTQDTTYTVNIQGVVVNGRAMNFTYQVFIFDPGS